MIPWFPSKRLAFVAILTVIFMWHLLVAASTHFAHAAEHKPIRWLFNGGLSGDRRRRQCIAVS